MAFARLAGAQCAAGPRPMSSRRSGPTAAFFVMWMYWVSVWSPDGGYRRRVRGAATATLSGGLAGPDGVVPLAICADLRRSPRSICAACMSAGEFQVITTLIKLLPLIAVIVVAGISRWKRRASRDRRAPAVSASRRHPASRAHPVRAGRLRGRRRCRRQDPAIRSGRSRWRRWPAPASPGCSISSAARPRCCSCSYADSGASTSPFADAIAPTVGAGVARIVAALHGRQRTSVR